MRKIIATITLLAQLAVAAAQVTVADLADCDLVFVVNHKGDAITNVTHGTQGLNINHMAIVCTGAQGGPMLLQADGRGVHAQWLDHEPLRDASGKPRLLVGRINVPFSPTLSLQRAVGYLGAPYDWNYSDSDSAIYCSELATKCIVGAGGQPVLGTVPMEFRDSSGNIPQYWLEHYGKQGLPVPEGEPGSNPGEVSRRPQVTIMGWLEGDEHESNQKQSNE